MYSVDYLVKHFNMTAHPEGGFFYQSYKSNISIEAPIGKRVASTAIYFLITKESISHLHRLSSDEVWHYYMGDPLVVIEITPEGELIETEIGPNLEKGQKLQHVVPAGHWFASTSRGEYSLVGCTVAPGFEFEDFEMGKKESLKKLFPHLDKTIEKYSLN